MSYPTLPFLDMIALTARVFSAQLLHVFRARDDI